VGAGHSQVTYYTPFLVAAVRDRRSIHSLRSRSTPKRADELRRPDWFRQVLVHPCFQAALTITLHRISRHGNYAGGAPRPNA
jgi:hypothetical protein